MGRRFGMMASVPRVSGGEQEQLKSKVRGSSVENSTNWGVGAPMRE